MSNQRWVGARQQQEEFRWSGSRLAGRFKTDRGPLVAARHRRFFERVQQNGNAISAKSSVLPFDCVLLLSLACVLICGCGQSPPTKSDPEDKSQSSAPQVTLKILDLDGIEQLKQSHRGKVVIVDYWSTSCTPCMKAFPGLVALSKKYPKQVACISLSLDYEGIGKPQDKRDNVLKFLRGQGAAFENVLCSQEADVLYGRYDIDAPPVVDVYDRDGKLAERFDNSGATSEEDEFTYEDIGRLVAKLAGRK